MDSHFSAQSCSQVRSYLDHIDGSEFLLRFIYTQFRHNRVQNETDSTLSRCVGSEEPCFKSSLGSLSCSYAITHLLTPNSCHSDPRPAEFGVSNQVRMI